MCTARHDATETVPALFCLPAAYPPCIVRACVGWESLRGFGISLCLDLESLIDLMDAIRNMSKKDGLRKVQVEERPPPPQDTRGSLMDEINSG
jgi:hypothetical protein